MNTPIKPKLQRFQTALLFACPICQLGLRTWRPVLNIPRAILLIWRNLAMSVQPRSNNRRTMTKKISRILANLGSRFYEPILTAIGQKFPTSARILDIGLRRRLYSRKLQAYPKATFYSFDLSRSVQLAAKSDASWKVDWFVGDLAHLPIQSKSMDVIWTSSPG